MPYLQKTFAARQPLAWHKSTMKRLIKDGLAKRRDDTSRSEALLSTPIQFLGIAESGI